MPSAFDTSQRLLQETENVLHQVRSLLDKELHKIKRIHPHLDELEREQSINGGSKTNKDESLNYLINRVEQIELYLTQCVMSYPRETPADGTALRMLSSAGPRRNYNELTGQQANYPFLGGNRNIPPLNHGHSGVYRRRTSEMTVCGAHLYAEISNTAQKYALYNKRNVCNGVLPVPPDGVVAIPHGEWELRVWEGKVGLTRPIHTIFAKCID
eukprot:PhF_6_TR37185/c0_g2_i2/m.54789